MARCGPWRLAFSTALISASLLGLAAACLVSQTPQPAPKQPKDFPVNLWSAAKSDDYVGDEACTGCHADQAASLKRSAHAAFVSRASLPAGHKGCEACHGPGKKHIERISEGDAANYIFRPTSAKPAEVSRACLRCHESTMTASHWKRTGHAKADVSCLSCHYVHKDAEQDRPAIKSARAAKTVRSAVFPVARETGHLLRDSEANLCASCHQREVNEFRRSFHHPVPEGRMTCSDCHSLHPGKNQASKTAGRTGARTGQEACVKCHADKAGPFVYSHDPVSGNSGEGCAECHRPHGSGAPKMLTALSRGLCNQCHSDKAVTHYPGQTCWSSLCHAGLHGSNHDPKLITK